MIRGSRKTGGRSPDRIIDIVVFSVKLLILLIAVISAAKPIIRAIHYLRTTDGAGAIARTAVHVAHLR